MRLAWRAGRSNNSSGNGNGIDIDSDSDSDSPMNEETTMRHGMLRCGVGRSVSVEQKA